MNPVVIHVIRPYDSEQEYLAAEAWSIEARSMVLVDAAPLPPDTPVLFDVALSDGHKPIRAEGRVAGTVAPSGDRPGGVRVRFRRFGAATKAFIERAVQAKSSPTAAEPPAPEDRVSLPEVRPSMTDLEAPTPPPSTVEARSQQEPSGIRERVRGPIAAPANREELLARLRQRRQTG